MDALQSYNDHIFEDIRPTKKSNIEDLNNEALHAYIERNKPNFSKNSFLKKIKLCNIIDSTDNTYPT